MPVRHAWAKCSLKKALDDPTHTLNLQPPQPLPDRTILVPFVLTGDEAFGLASYMLRPYPHITTMGEIDTGIELPTIAYQEEEESRWRCFRVPFLLCPEKVKVITVTTLILHYWSRADNSSRNIYCPPAILDRENSVTGDIMSGTWSSIIPTEDHDVHRFVRATHVLLIQQSRYVSISY